jgi:hypothetical protein
MQVAFAKVRIQLLANHLDQSIYLANQEQVFSCASGFCQPDVCRYYCTEQAEKKNVEPKPFLLSLFCQPKCFVIFWGVLFADLHPKHVMQCASEDAVKLWWGWGNQPMLEAQESQESF